MLLCGILLGFEQDKTSHDDKETREPPVRYKAEEGLPKNKLAETLRNYAIMEAILNDLTSPRNPEYRMQIDNKGLSREIVINVDNELGNLSLWEPGKVSHNSDGKDPRPIPDEMHADLYKRIKLPRTSLHDFKPANPKILVRDLNKEFDGSSDFVFDFVKKYPSAWGYVWGWEFGYSKDGKSVIVALEGGPNGNHGLSWTYMLINKDKRWEVVWRHCNPRE